VNAHRSGTPRLIHPNGDFERAPRTGEIVASSLTNIRLALTKLGVRLHYDEFSRELCVDEVPLTDLALDRLWVRIDDAFGFRPGKDLLRTVMQSDAQEQVVHPVRDRLAALAWDGRPRLDRWLTTYAGASDSPFVRAVGALVLIAAVRRVREPGAKFDYLLILESAQGMLKSSALRALCLNEDWFSDDLPLGVDSRQVIERTKGKLIIEAAELQGIRGREAETLKAFLSRQTDGPVRLAYGRLPVSVPRQFVLIGTTNSRTAYLNDATGARRFWPVPVRRFDVDALSEDREQLWAEAAVREESGALIHLNPAHWGEAAVHQEARRAVDPWEELLTPLLEGERYGRSDRVPVKAIWEAIGVEVNQRDYRHGARVAAIMQRHGFTEKKNVRLEGEVQYCWLRGDLDGEERP